MLPVVIIGLVTSAILIIIGFFVKYKKAYWLISGYNTMSDEKKKNVDVEGLAGFIWKFCLALAVIFIASSLLMYFKEEAIAGIVFALLIPCIIFTLVKAQKYDGNTRDSNGSMNVKTKIMVGAVAAFLLLSAAGAGVFLHYSSIPSEFTVESGILNISGMYGQKIPVSEISSLEIKDSIPEILYKSNGSALGDTYKGYFKLKGIDRAKLFIIKSKPPFVFFTYNDIRYVINCKDGEATRELYNKLTAE